jgi:hypothetical protein
MTRKRIQVSFAHAQPVTGVHPPSVGHFVSVIIDVDLTGESFRSSRGSKRRSAGRPGPQQLRMQPKPPFFSGARSPVKPRRLISVRTDYHTIRIFYRHVL